MFPLLLSLPTGSLREFTRYIQRLLSHGKKSISVVTRFSLKKTVNAGGIAYSQAQFRAERTLTEQDQAAITQLADQVKEYAKHTTATSIDLEEFTDVPVPFDPETGEIGDQK